MQSNTAAVENRSINFPNFPVEKKTYKSDHFTISDGRCIGSDGFVVPSDFEEFYERFPDYVRKWVSKHADRSAPKEDLEDRTQDLLIHLQHLPQTSKYREAGKKDIVQTFDPVKHYGANQARFQNYVNLCLANKLKTIHSKRMKDALFRPGNLSLGEQMGGEDLSTVDDEFCHSHSEYLRRAANASEKQSNYRAFLQQFVDFVRREDPKVLSTIEALLAAGTQGEASDLLGITETEFGRKRTRLSQLAKCFVSGEPVPRQRRPYKRRVGKSKEFQARIPIGLSRLSDSPETRMTGNRQLVPKRQD
jgi:hypothetical protein